MRRWEDKAVGFQSYALGQTITVEVDEGLYRNKDGAVFSLNAIEMLLKNGTLEEVGN